MQSKLKSVDAYMKTVPAERKDALVQLRKYCLEELKGYQESMEYGAPCYSRNGIAEVGFNSQKHFIALYILKKDILDLYRTELNKMKGISVGKGCIRYSNPKKIDFDIVRKLLAGTYRSREKICPR